MTSRFIRNVLLKGLLLFLVFNFVWVGVDTDALGRVSLYNHLWRGRERFPFGENPAEDYNLSLFNFEAMYTSHKLDGSSKSADEFRVIVIGDSSTWGTLLHPQQTLAGLLDAANLRSADGRKVRVYNLGYPTLSLVKDLMVLDGAMRYSPDLILWPLTLESFPRGRQAESPIVANNPERLNELIERYDLDITPAAGSASLWQRTIIGQRRELADLLRLQVYGILWSATGIDQAYPPSYATAARDLEADENFHNWAPPAFPEGWLALDLIDAGVKIAGDVPLVIINEPIMISSGANSDIRYNFYYPRWAFDLYRLQMESASAANGWYYLDLWNLVSEEEFTNSAIHLSPAGEEILALEIIESGIIQSLGSK